MKGDFSRSTFTPVNHFSSVRMKQGSVILDSEMNEEVDILGYIERTTNVDVIGATGAPYHDPSTFLNFKVALNSTATDLVIAPGRMYVDGILCENDFGKAIEFTKQPDFPNATLPKTNGNFAVFLDVWERFITPVDQVPDAFPSIRETALGGADTASRTRVVWQVKLAPTDSADCKNFVAPAQSTGKLRAQAEPPQAAVSDCLVPAGGGYRRLENQLYRVEIHDSATFKYSRDNASQASKIKATDQVASVITVDDPGRDEILGFASAKFVEITDEERTLNGLPGLLLEVDSVVGSTVKIKNPSNAGLAGGTNPILRRWDGTGTVSANQLIALEDGVQIMFDGGTLAAGDYWMIPARTLTGRVEWPGNGSVFQPRHGTIHHFAPLAIVSFTGQSFKGAPKDCRNLFPPLTAIKASDVSYEPGQCPNLKGADTVQEALDILCQGSGDQEPGIRIKAVGLVNPSTVLLNDSVIAAKDFAEGVRIVCDNKLFAGSVINDKGLAINPICHITVDIPWPMNPPERDLWGIGDAFTAFQTLTVASLETVQENEIVWTPTGAAKKWLVERLLSVIQLRTQGQVTRVLARMTLKGNFIWGPEETPKFYLDGEVFGSPVGARTNIKLPSGDGRRGGDFEMWFWLAPEPVRPPPFGFITGRPSRFFSQQAGPRALQFAIERAGLAALPDFPPDYVVDATQAFDRDQASVLARSTQVSGISIMTSDKFGRLVTALGQMIENNTRIRVVVQTVTEDKLVLTIRNMLSAGNAPDAVFGDDQLVNQLAQLGYTNTPLIRL